MPKTKDLYEEIETKSLSPQARKSLNIDFPQYMTGVEKIKSLRAGSNLGGYVKKDEPQTVYLNEKSIFEPVSTLGHEATHVAQDLANKDLYESQEKNNKDFYTYRLGLGGPMMSYPSDKMNEIYKNAEKVFNEYKDKKIFSSSFPNSQSEMMADLQGIEASLPKGQTILDTDIGKKMFPTPELQHFYLQSSLPYTTKMLEYNPSMFSVAIEKARKAIDTFKDEAVSKSYANAAMSAFMKLTGK
jgi:hypothetical protein